MTIEIGGPSSGGEVDYDGGCGGGSSRNVAARRFGPTPAFLIKTFQIVNDANTNSIVSWGQNGESFIIWDHIKFSAEILPNYFKHNNFFVYQLNNYGFRKIGVDHQWEYLSGDFQQGKAHLLSNMKRRSVPTPPRQKTLRNSLEESRREMKKMKKQQSDMELNIVQLRQAANNLEASSKKLVVQWAKACEIMVAKRETKVLVAENALVSLPQKQPVVTSSPSAADDESNYSAELDNLNKRLFENDDNAVEAANHHAISQEWLIHLW